MAIKKMKFERKAARAARQTIDPLATPSPAPDLTQAMAAGGEEVNRGNSDRIQLSATGEQQAQDVAHKLSAKGGLDKLVVSPANRTEQMAQPIIDQNPQMPVRSEPALESWAQGNAEGEPQSAVQGQIRDLVRKNPRRVIPGQGAMSSRPGESFDQFRGRALPAMRGIMQEFAEGIQQNPNYKLGVPLHSQVSKLTKAWIKNGAPDDFSIKPEEMDKDAGPPGGVEHLFPNEKGEWEANDVDLESPEPLGPGIYLIRHGATPQNQESYGKADQQQRSLAKMVASTRTLDVRGMNKWAQAASKAGMPDEEISKYIDLGLPDSKTVASLPMPQVLAAIAAAGPQKKQEYAPLLKSHFGDLGSLPPELQQTMAAHLAAIQNT